MGLELATIASISAGLQVAGGIAETVGGRKSAKGQRKANEVGRANQAAAQAEQNRQRVRQDRVRRARIVAASEASGTSGSSSEAGALNSASTLSGAAKAFSTGQATGADSQSAQLQAAQNTADKSRLVGSVFQLAGSAVEAFPQGKPNPQIKASPQVGELFKNN